MDFIQPSSFIIQSVNIAVIIYVLRRFLFIPYLAHIDSEILKREELEAKTANATLVVEAANAEAKELLTIAKNDANEIRKNARELAKRETSLALSKSNDEAAGIKKQALEEIASERLTLEKEMRSKILGVAISLNAKLFGDSKKNTELLEQFAKQI